MTGATPILYLSALLVYAGAKDLYTMRISNLLVAAVAISYVLFALAADTTPVEFGLALLRAAVVLGIGFLLFLPGWVGAGDVKLASAVALWFEMPEVILYFLLVNIAGSLLVLLLFILRRAPRLSASLPSSLAHLAQADARLPYGVAFAVAAAVMAVRSI